MTPTTLAALRAAASPGGACRSCNAKFAAPAVAANGQALYALADKGLVKLIRRGPPVWGITPAGQKVLDAAK